MSNPFNIPSPSPVAVFKGAANEKACMKIMSNLKFKGECLSSLQHKVNISIELIEDLVVKTNSDESKMLLLQTMELYKRSKCVASYEVQVTNTVTSIEGSKTTNETGSDGKHMYMKSTYVLPINTTDWQVSVTKAKKVRIHLNAKKAEEIKKMSIHWSNVSLYCI
jgi:hypothetical protein